MDLINIPIRYLESSLDTSYAISAESLLDKPTVNRIFSYAAETFGRELKWDFKLSEGCPMPFNFEVTSGLTDDKGQPKKARAFTGKFLLSLKAEEHAKGFPFLVKRIQEEHRIAHTQLVDLLYSEDENSGKKKGKKEAGKQNSNVEVLSGKVEVLSSENLELKGKVEELKGKVEELEGKVEVLCRENLELKAELKALGDGQRVASAVRLRIAMEEAHERLMVDLNREPGPESSWADFMQSITPAEKAGLLQNVSQKALELMVTEKRKLNQIVHVGYILDVAAAIICVQDKREAWIDLFKYAYKQDPIELVFGE